MPRPGIFPILPTQGLNYYSLLDQLTGEQRTSPPNSGYALHAITPWPYFDAHWRYVDNIPP